MFDFINKEEYFRWADEGLVTSEHFGLKAAQDAFILSILSGKSRLRILEIGGGNSRVLRTLAPMNECWNIDAFDGQHGGPKEEIIIPGVRNVVGLIGDFSPELPDNYFDYVVSVSVVEHIPDGKLLAAFKDCCRVLRPDGFTAHAIDVYLIDANQIDHPHQENVRNRLARYCTASKAAGLELIEPAAVGESPSFSSRYLSNPDSVMRAWNKSVPVLRPLREVAQSTSLKAIWQKHAI